MAPVAALIAADLIEIAVSDAKAVCVNLDEFFANGSARGVGFTKKQTPMSTPRFTAVGAANKGDFDQQSQLVKRGGWAMGGWERNEELSERARDATENKSSPHLMAQRLDA